MITFHLRSFYRVVTHLQCWPRWTVCLNFELNLVAKNGNSVTRWWCNAMLTFWYINWVVLCIYHRLMVWRVYGIGIGLTNYSLVTTTVVVLTAMHTRGLSKTFRLCFWFSSDIRRWVADEVIPVRHRLSGGPHQPHEPQLHIARQSRQPRGAHHCWVRSNHSQAQR